MNVPVHERTCTWTYLYMNVPLHVMNIPGHELTCTWTYMCMKWNVHERAVHERNLTWTYCIRVTLFARNTYSRSEYTLYLVPSIPLKVFYRFISIFWDTTVESFLTYIRVIPISWDSPFTPKETIFFQNSCVESTHSSLYHQWSHPAGPR